MHHMNLTDLPVECLSHILTLTTPKDAARSSVVSRQFLSASESNYVWEKFIPSDCDDFISQSSTPIDEQIFKNKKDLFLYLWQNPILLNNNAQSFALDNWTGKKIFMLGARKLEIAWGDTRIYWSWKYMSESRFPGVASLITVCWLDIRGKFHTKYLSPNTTYGVYFVYKEHPAIGRCYGFERTPVEASVIEADEEELSTDDNEHPIKKFYLKAASYTRAVTRPEQCPTERNDGWLEVEMGRYHVGENASNERQVLEMRIKQIQQLIWKSGLIVYGIELRPLIDY